MNLISIIFQVNTTGTEGPRFLTTDTPSEYINSIRNAAIILLFLLVVIPIIIYILKLISRCRNAGVIESLPLVSCGSAEKNCSICLTQIGLGEIVKLIPRCGHVFHPKCIDKWLLSNLTCPMCRSSKMLDEADVEKGFCSRTSVHPTIEA